LCRDAKANSFLRRSKRVTKTPFKYNLDGRGITSSSRLLPAKQISEYSSTVQVAELTQ